MASIHVILVIKTSALNAVYFIFVRAHWVCRDSIVASSGTRSWPFCGSQGDAM